MKTSADIITIADAWGRPKFTGTFRRIWLHLGGAAIVIHTERLA